MFRAVYVVGVATILVALLAGDFHFLSDVIAGAFVGGSLSALVVNMWELLDIHGPLGIDSWQRSALDGGWGRQPALPGSIPSRKPLRVFGSGAAYSPSERFRSE
jgi:hypothetical protein